MTDQLDDGLDREIRAYLAWRTERVDAAPSATEMVALVAGGQATNLRSMWPASRVRVVAAAALLVIALVAVLLVGSGSNPLLVTTTAEPTNPLAADVEPINGWIAYATRAHGATSGVEGEIFLAIAGQPVLRVAGGGGETVCPTFSPDGTKLLYMEGQDLVVLGGDPAHGMTEVDRTVVVTRTHGTCPIWSPSSEEIAVLTREGIEIHGPGSDRLVAAAEPMGFGTCICNPLAWRPDGTAIAYATRDGIWLVDPHGSNSQRISLAVAWSLDWSSDGSRLAYTTTRLEEDRQISEVAVLTLGQPAGVVVLGEGDRPAWEPNGDTIAFSAPEGLVVVEADGSGRRVVKAAAGYGFGGWSPKGDYLLYMIDRSGSSYDLWAVSTIDSGLVHITPTNVETGSSRNFPDLGDVSWQAIFP